MGTQQNLFGETTQPIMQAPFPYFGGKRHIATFVWQLFGEIKNYVEPFFGSGAVLLNRPNVNLDSLPIETVNDIDGFLVNFWRSIQNDFEKVAFYANYPVSSIDISARHGYLINRKERLNWALEDLDYYDAKIAGYWLYGTSSWIGAEFCKNTGVWSTNGAHFFKGKTDFNFRRQFCGSTNSYGKGINTNTVQNVGLYQYLEKLCHRLKRVRIAFGDWNCVLSNSGTLHNGVTGIFLDPPYCPKNAKIETSIYDNYDHETSKQVNDYCVKQAEDPLIKIIICGYEGEHNNLENLGYTKYSYVKHCGYQKKDCSNKNNTLERIWYKI